MANDRPSMPLSTAAVSWVDSNGGQHIRVYSSDGYMVKERCNDGGATWFDGAFNQPGRAVSATVRQAGDGLHIRVYCTISDVTTEWCWDGAGNWYQGAYTTT
jgi:hypothetical protein